MSRHYQKGVEAQQRTVPLETDRQPLAADIDEFAL
jgi:hypothetical protein